MSWTSCSCCFVHVSAAVAVVCCMYSIRFRQVFIVGWSNNQTFSRKRFQPSRCYSSELMRWTSCCCCFIRASVAVAIVWCMCSIRLGRCLYCGKIKQPDAQYKTVVSTQSHEIEPSKCYSGQQLRWTSCCCCCFVRASAAVAFVCCIYSICFIRFIVGRSSNQTFCRKR